MSYIVLARKYRPQNFDEVYAQEQVTNILKNAIAMNRIAHAYLFTGSRGVGKTSMARIFAKSLNCMEGMSPHPCNKCENCVEITQGTSTDVVEIDGASNTGVDDIRDLQKELMYSTTKSKYKIFIIDEVHMLSKNAFNALLKTLEEPPERVLFIFATTEPHKVLPTIISRCQRYDFKRIPIEAIVARLKFICDAEGITIEEEGFYHIAKKADGSMRDALSLLDQLMAVGGKEIKTNEVLMIFGMVSNEVYHKITEYLQQKKTAAIIALLHNILEKGNDLQEFINGYLEYVRILLLLKTGVPQPELPTTLKDEMAKINESYNEDTLLYILSMLIKARTDIRQSANPLLIMEMTLIKLTKLEEMTSIVELMGKLPEEPKLQQPPQIREQLAVHPKISPSISETSNTYTLLGEKPTLEVAEGTNQSITVEKFEQTKDQALKSEALLTATYLKQSTLLRVENNRLYFETPSESAFNYIKDKQADISQGLSRFYKTSLSINIELKAVKKDDKGFIKNPNLQDIEKESPNLAQFIEETASSISQLNIPLSFIPTEK